MPELDLRKWGRPTPAIFTATAVALLLATHFFLGFFSLIQKSPTFDEPAHLASGYIAAQYGDFRFNPEGGQIAQRWAALPLLLWDIQHPELEPERWRHSTDFSSDSYVLGEKLLFPSGQPAIGPLTCGRLMILASSLFLGSLLFFWSRHLFGTLGGLITLTLYAFSPTLLAHATLVTADLIAAFFFSLALLSIWRTLHKVSFPHILITGLALGGLLLSKYSGILIAPITLMLIITRLAWGKPLICLMGRRRIVTKRSQQTFWIALAATASLLVAWGIIWSAYGFRFDASFDPVTVPLSEKMRPQYDHKLLEWFNDYRLFPQSYLYGFDFTLHHSQARSAFMNGQYSNTGWRTFFPYAFLIKTTIPLLLLLFAGPLILLLSPQKKKHLYTLFPLIFFILIFSIVAIRSHINIGHRHLLPLYPFFAILAGSTALFIRIHHLPSRIASGIMILTLLLWHASAALWIAPHYLAYFNPIAGGPQHGYRHLVDSSLDWGQDLFLYERWLSQQSENQPNYLAYFGSITPSNYPNISTRTRNLAPYGEQSPHLPFDFAPGHYAISATVIQNTYGPSPELPPGPWTEDHEAEYQQLLPLAHRYFSTHQNPQAIELLASEIGPTLFKKAIHHFEGLRFHRLCAFLLQRHPDQMIGYSILIYELTSKDLNTAILGPAESFISIHAPCNTHLERFQSICIAYPQCLKQLAASLAVTWSSTDCMADHNASRVRQASKRNHCLILANTISIGFRSGRRSLRSLIQP